MQIKRVPISSIRAAAYNPRKDLQPGDAEYEKLKRSIERFDMVEPLVWNRKTKNLVGGHQRLKVLKAMGVKHVEVSVVSLGDADEKALNVALNKISGDWDLGKLKGLLEGLDKDGYDISLTGFDEKELRSVMEYGGKAGLTDDDAAPEPPAKPTTKLGDVYELGGGASPIMRGCHAPTIGRDAVWRGEGRPSLYGSAVQRRLRRKDRREAEDQERPSFRRAVQNIPARNLSLVSPRQQRRRQPLRLPRQPVPARVPERDGRSGLLCSLPNHLGQEPSRLGLHAL